MALRNFSSTAAQTTLSAGVTSASTTLMVAATTGFPPAPFILAVNAGAAAQELVLVTAVAGNNLTVTRGYDSTVASAHDAGAVIQHSHAALDFREANTHVNATANVHGLAVGSALVGTTDTQTLANKTLTAPALTAPTASGSLTGFGGAWTAYTPAWTASTTNPTLGDGTLTGRYLQIGKTVHWTIDLTTGSTTTYGAGVYSFSLPLNAQGARAPGAGHIFNTTGPFIPVVCQRSLINTVRLISTINGAQITDANSGLSSGEQVNLCGTYEAA